MSEQHNEFIRRHVMSVGRDLFDQGTFAAQLVALESLTAGLFAAVITNEGKSRAEAEVFLSVLTHGLRGRLDKMLPDLE